VRAASPLVTHLTVKIAEEEAPAYLPGQYMNIVLPDSGVRSFSMASAPKDGLVDFHIRRLERGRFTDERLSRLRPGDRLDVELPLGSFCFRAEDYRPLLMVATGTGLAPLKAMLEQLMDCDDCPPVSLYWGTRTAEDLYLHDAITRWSERLYEFNYVPVLSRPDAAWQGRRGYVQDAVCADLDDLSEHAIYLCGSPQMISSAKQAFLARGASAAHLYSEGFIPQTAPAVAA
jgi:CDP-4-dehydro-6-deoxyglucose reductase, E3